MGKAGIYFIGLIIFVFAVFMTLKSIPPPKQINTPPASPTVLLDNENWKVTMIGYNSSKEFLEVSNKSTGVTHLVIDHYNAGMVVITK